MNLPPAVLSNLQGRNVPRYTSYPPATRFSQAVGQASYRQWLEAVPAQTAFSVYVHIPFCRQLCWFCGCHTQVVHRPGPIESYLEALRRELAAVSALLPNSARVTHVHWGGGTPSLLDAAHISRLAGEIRRHFCIGPNAEFAVEVDPRGFDASRAAALAQAGVTRASLGVQELNLRVQVAVNRVQSLEQTAAAVAVLRQHGIDSINIDLMYGLPRQTVADLLTTIEAVLSLAPARLALFGYAHVPWLKRQQRLIDGATLPGAAERLTAFQAGAERLARAGYVAIGLDHFALPDDGLARAAQRGRLCRNFQGYTADSADVLLGFGASAIGRLEQGYVQNTAAVPAYLQAVRQTGLASFRGFHLSREDRLRGEIIARLMCDLCVDLTEVAARHGEDVSAFTPELAALAQYAADGLVQINGGAVRVADEARPLLRSIAATFDCYLDGASVRHAVAV